MKRVGILSREILPFYFKGVPQYITMEFQKPVVLKRLEITFQGGFCGKDCSLLRLGNAQKWVHVEDIFPDDNNDVQVH